MTDLALENALRTRDDLRLRISDALQQVEEWRAKMVRAERFISDWEEFSGETAPQGNAVSEHGPDEGGNGDSIVQRRMSAKARNPKKEEVAEAAVALLRENQGPMNRSELKDALAAKGVIIYGTRPEVVLQTMLWRTNDIVAHIKGFGYWPADTAYLPGGYDPNGPVEDEPDVLDEDTAMLV